MAATIGIDDLSVYIPQLYLPIEALARERDIPYAKLNKGLGLEQMALADAREDAATMAANAVLDLIHKNDLEPSDIGRIYLGTESAFDGAKPTATYVLDMLQDHFADVCGTNCLLHCDVVDLTFACIGGVDALQNCLEWTAAKDGRQAIVVTSDKAKYELKSTGEYTQGAGAVAMLIKQNPRLLAIDPDFGVATRPAHDFFKPLRRVQKRDLIREVIEILPDRKLSDYDLGQLEEQLGESLHVDGVLDCNDCYLTLHKETPVFDGPYSNEAYTARIREALMDYRRRTGGKAGELTDRYAALAFHLPYAYQGRRMFPELYMEELKARDEWAPFIDRNGLDVPCADDYDDREAYLTRCAEFLKQVSKTQDYRDFAAQYIAPGEWASARVGNLYAGSVFLSIASTLEAALDDDRKLTGERLLVFAYGSGSKAKVFAAEVQPAWREVTAGLGLRRRLDNRQEVDYATYERLHRNALNDNVAAQTAGSFFLAEVHDERGATEGARHYGYRAEAALV